MEDGELDRLGLERRRDDLGRRDVEVVAHAHAVARSTRAIVHAHALGVDPTPRLRARDARNRRERAVEPLIGFRLADDEVEIGHGA